MRVLHVGGGDLAVGAANGGYILHKALRARGVDSRFLLSDRAELLPPSPDAGDVMYSGAAVQQQVDRWIMRAYPKRTGWTLTTSGMAGDNAYLEDEIASADLLHLHWIGNGALDLIDLADGRIPIVVTLRDMWFFTGVCSCSLDCSRHLDTCSRCPQLGSQHPFDLSTYAQFRKRQIVERLGPRLSVVAIADWLRSAAEASSVFGGVPVRHVRNAITIDAFSPVLRDVTRQRLGAGGDRVVMFAASSVKRPRKGLPLFQESLRHLARHPGLHVLIVGEGATSVDLALPSGARATRIEFVKSEAELAGLYAAADVFVAPYIQEPFGKTLVEAMACGTPVVALRDAGPVEIIEHETDGYLAPPGSAVELARGVSWVLDHPDAPRLRDACMQHARRKFSSTQIAGEYIDVYEQLLARQGGGRARIAAPPVQPAPREAAADADIGPAFAALRTIFAREDDASFDAMREEFIARAGVDREGFLARLASAAPGPAEWMWLWASAVIGRQFERSLWILQQQWPAWGDAIVRELERMMLHWNRTRQNTAADHEDVGRLRLWAGRAQERGQQVAVFGAGQLGRRVLATLRGEGCDVKALIDNDPAKWGTRIDSTPVVPPATLSESTFVFVASLWDGEVTEQLSAMRYRQGDHFVTVL